MRDNCPGGEYSGWPGSRSIKATPVGFADFDRLDDSTLVYKSLFVRSLANVDFPDDLGPQIIVEGTF